jgi:hypothetical protein
MRQAVPLLMILVVLTPRGAAAQSAGAPPTVSRAAELIARAEHRRTRPADRAALLEQASALLPDDDPRASGTLHVAGRTLYQLQQYSARCSCSRLLPTWPTSGAVSAKPRTRTSRQRSLRGKSTRGWTRNACSTARSRSRPIRKCPSPSAGESGGALKALGAYTRRRKQLVLRTADAVVGSAVRVETFVIPHQPFVRTTCAEFSSPV